MNHIWSNFALTFVAIFVALDIVGTLPVYAGMTSRMNKGEKRRVVNVSMLVALVVALAFVFIGKVILKFLGISLADFKVAGGIVLLLISLSDLVGSHEAQSRASGSTGVVPLAVPLITGPGVLATLMLQVGIVGTVLTVAALLTNYLLAWVLLRKCDVITNLIGKDGMVVISKVAALLLAAIAIALIRGGVFDAVKMFGALK